VHDLSKKAIGYVLMEFPVFTETFVGVEMRAMLRHGHRIIPITFTRPIDHYQSIDSTLANQTQYLTDITAREASIYLMRRVRRLFNTLPFIFRQTAMNTKDILLDAARIAIISERYSCDHLHAHFAHNATTLAIVASRLAGITVSFVGHGFDIYVRPRDLKLKLLAAGFAVAVCRDMMDDFRNLCPAANIIQVECGLELDRYPIREQDCYREKKDLIFIGRLVEKKGLYYLIQALSAMPEEERPNLDIVGEGPLLPELKNMVEVQNLQSFIRFLGKRDSQWIIENLPSYYSLVAPFCQSTNGDRDTGPLVLKEAMALGVPVITTEFMGCKEIVDSDVGIKVRPKDSAALRWAIGKMMNLSKNEYEVMSRKCRINAEHNYVSNILTIKLSETIESGRKPSC
jgi:glycosyltransferase involved in cell wall biosynthesis